MNGRLREINQSLQALDEAHRLGRITREEYRARRRRLVGTLSDGGGITARNTVSMATVPRAQRAGSPVHDDTMTMMFPRRTRWFGWIRRLFSRP